MHKKSLIAKEFNRLRNRLLTEEKKSERLSDYEICL